MPIDNKHSSYTAKAPLVERVADCHSGGDAVKAKGAGYLPKLGGQSIDDYDAYKMRGLFMPAVRRTEKGLTGAIMRKAPSVEVPESAEFLVKDTGDDDSLEMLARKSIEQLQVAGRVGVLVDHNGERPTISLYTRESIINWSSRFIILMESHEGFDDKDPYNVLSVPQIRELTFDENGRYIQNLYREGVGKKWILVESITPNKQGEALGYLPFFVANPVDNSFDDHNPLLLDLADINLDHYRLCTDERHGLHFTALPTMFLFGSMGTDDEGNQLPIRVGPGAVNHMPMTDGKAELLEFSGAGLKSIADAKADDVAMMAAIGARLLQAQRKGVQAAETARIEQSGESATLTTVAESVENMLANALRVAVWWLGGNPDDVVYELNKDFLDASMEPGQLQALTQAWQSGAMSLDSYLWNLKRGELLPDDRSIEDELELIADGGEVFDLNG